MQKIYIKYSYTYKKYIKKRYTLYKEGKHIKKYIYGITYIYKERIYRKKIYIKKIHIEKHIYKEI